MSEGKTPRAPGLDRLLGDWPTASRTALEWDDAAEQVMSHIGSDEPARTAYLVSDEDLLRPALPSSPGEVQSSAAIVTGSEGIAMGTVTRERDRDRASLKDLAKLATTTAAPSASGAFFGAPVPRPTSPTSSEPPREEKQENSGMINLGALAAAEEAAKKPAASVSLPPLDRGAMSTMRSVTPPKPVQAKAVEKKSSSSWLAIGGVVAAAAVAAGVFFGMQRGQHSAPLAAMPAPPAAPTVAAAQAAVQPAPAAATPIAPADQGVDPSTLPQAQTQAQLALGAPARGVVPVVPVSSKPANGALAATTTAPTTPPALVATIPTATAPAPTSSDQSLQNLMQQAAGSSPTATAAAAPAATSDTPEVAPGSVPIKPSQGAIQGALGAALPGARACLGADDPISHATITFKSDGSVQSVGISGGASGKPAEGCVRTALMKARVAPFAQPTFTATATVRPN